MNYIIFNLRFNYVFWRISRTMMNWITFGKEEPAQSQCFQNRKTFSFLLKSLSMCTVLNFTQLFSFKILNFLVRRSENFLLFWEIHRIIGLHFAILNYKFWLFWKKTCVHSETNGTYVVFKPGENF